MILFVIGLLFAGWIFLTIRKGKRFITNYNEKCVFITGTDSGFGKNLALALDKKGVKVYAGCYTEDGINSLTNQSSVKMKCIKMDVTDEKSILAAREVIEADLNANHQCLWGLVNNAGIGVGSIFDLSTLANYRMCMNINYFGTINTTEIFLPLIKISKGRIVNVISIARRFHVISEPYACSKTALGVYNDGLRRHMKDYGIHVAGIEPGGYQTELSKLSNVIKSVDRDWQQLPGNLKIEFGTKFLEAVKQDLTSIFYSWSFGRYNHPNTVCEAMTNALFSTNPKTSYICGKDANLVMRFGLYVPDFLMDILSRKLLSKSRCALKSNLKDNTPLKQEVSPSHK